MKKIYYSREVSKNGKVRYVPVAEYDSNFLDSFTKGNHLVMSYPGGTSRRFNIDPNYAAMIAAGRVAEDAISKAVVRASEMRPHNKPITEQQKKAWENLAKAFGDDRYYVQIPSAREIAEEGVKSMMAEADKLMEHESVRKAYEHFMLMCQLTKEQPWQDTKQ
jgi:hypothetical protein